MRRKAPKATEVFGDELADLSEDEDKQSDDDHHEISGSQSRHLIVIINKFYDRTWVW